MSAPRGAALRRLLAAPSPIVLGGAHDALTARLVQEAGFEGVWASGFEISASHGVPDASILTMVIPIFIPRAEVGNCGELAAFGNKRPFRRFAVTHAFVDIDGPRFEIEASRAQKLGPPRRRRREDKSHNTQ